MTDNYEEDKVYKLKTSCRNKYIECPCCKTILYNKSQTCKNCNSILEVQKNTMLQEIKIYFKNYFISDVKGFFKTKFFKFFLLFNLNVFLIVGFANSLFRPYSIAKFFLSNAVAVNTLYIFPLSKLFGWNNIFAKPFYPVRELLYQTGLFFLPKYEGERESWWFAVRFKEYDDFVLPALYKLHTIRATYWDFKNLNKIEKYNDEVYEHILKLATLKIRDKHLRSRRYNQLVITLWKYRVGVGNAWIIKLHKYDRNSFFEDKRMKKFETLLNLFISQTDYIKKEEPEAYKYFKKATNHFYLDSVVLFQYSHKIVIRDLIKNKVIDNNKPGEIYNLSKFDKTYCNNKYFNIMTDSISRINTYLEDEFLSENTKIHIKNSSVNSICPNEDKMFSMCTNYESKY